MRKLKLLNKLFHSQYWSHYIKAKSQSLVTVNDDTVEYLDYIYDLQFKGEWMPCEYILSYQELSKLAIENYVRERTIIAYKDFKSMSLNGSKMIK